MPTVYFTEDHEWISVEGGVATVGITNYAQEQLGDLVYVEVPRIGDSINAGDRFGAVESVKAASDIYSPVGGEVIEINRQLEDDPETVNTDPYNDGWFFKLQPSDPAELDALLSAGDYQQLCEEE